MNISKLIKTVTIIAVFAISYSCNKNEVNQVSITGNATVHIEDSETEEEESEEKGIGEEEESEPIIQLSGRVILEDSTAVENQLVELLHPQDSSLVTSRITDQSGRFEMEVNEGYYLFRLDMGLSNPIYTTVFYLQDSTESVLIVLD